jgi:S-adenosylmethionine-diacylglycerol 3-amino-3-carboxypropyl transferase
VRNELVRDAALQGAGAASRRGALERLFARLFEGLVYAQIWEDPEVDLAALGLGPTDRVVAIASGGCNVMSYLTAGPGRVLAVDLNPAHLALLELKLAAARHLPDHASFYRLFAEPGRGRRNVALFDRLAPALSPAALRGWEGRDALGRRRAAMLGRNLHAHGLLGRTIGLAHLLCRLHGADPSRLLAEPCPARRRALFEAELGPVFRSPLVRALLRLPAPYFGLGIPPAQFEAMRADAPGGDLLALVRARVERLACDLPVADNWFAWQAFARRYPASGEALPPYLRAGAFAAVKANAGRVEPHHATVTDLLARQDAASLDAYVLLDAQDWMTPRQLAALWAQVGRTARPGARVIFRTAAAESPLPGAVPRELLAPWRYEAERSRELHARDRSAVYGGFHLYRLGAA